MDNTIISYDNLLCKLGIEKQYISPDTPKNKKVIRDKVRQLHDGEIKWQKLQGLLYGPLIIQADLINGVTEFIQMAHQHQCQVFIVSHKTQYSRYDHTKTNLRDASLLWMGRHNFFDKSHLGLKKNNIFFENSRSEKVKRISMLKCTYFIDDLEETFLEQSFPKHISKILYSPFSNKQVDGVTVIQNWKSIRFHIFGL